MRWLTTAEVGQMIQETAINVSRRCSAGQIRATKLGHEWRISEDAVTEFMAKRVAKSPRVRSTVSNRRAS